MVNAQLVATNFSKAIKDIKSLKSKADISKDINVTECQNRQQHHRWSD